MLVLIPAYNEAKRIAPVIAGALTSDLPVLVVDDGSRDDTVAVAEQAGATVLRQTPNQGKGAALRAGMRWALERGHNGVITLDADGQHDPAQILGFVVRHSITQSDLIIGARNFDEMPTTRRIANELGRRSFSWAVGEYVEDNQSGYRLLSKRMMEAVLDSDEQGFEFEVEMIVICLQKGYTLDWIPIRTIYGDQGSHINPVKHMVNWVRIVLKTRRAMRKKPTSDQ
ncbi:MAG: glycosyltransferase family 2 protein [Anaerolineae bacterium]